MLSKLRAVLTLDPSRRRQWLYFIGQRLKTALVLRHRMRGCGTRNIIERPLFWTPEWITIGNGCHVWPGNRIEGVSRHGEQVLAPHIVLGDNVAIQQNCHITAASTLVIGNDVNVLCAAVITDIDHGYDDPSANIAMQPLHVRETRIGDNCFIGAGAKILAGTTLGSYCVVGANSVVRGRFPAGSMIAGIPGQIIKRYDAASKSWQRVRPNHTDASLHPSDEGSFQ